MSDYKFQVARTSVSFFRQKILRATRRETREKNAKRGRHAHILLWSAMPGLVVSSSVGRPLEPSRRCRATSSSSSFPSSPLPPPPPTELRRLSAPWWWRLSRTVADIRMNEDLVLRGHDENPRRSSGEIGSRLHRAGYTHDKTHRATRIMRESERIRGGGVEEGGGREERGRRRKVTGARRAWRNFSRFRDPTICDSRLAARERNIAESQRDTRRHAQFSGNRNAFTHRLKRDYTGRPATTRDSRGTNHHRLLTSGPPATSPTSVRSRGNERWTGR